MKSEERRQGRGWSPENGSKPVPDLNNMQGSQTQSDVHPQRLLFQKHRQDKSGAPYLLSLFKRFKSICIYMETMATTPDDLLTKACKVLLLPPETLLAGQMSYILF